MTAAQDSKSENPFAALEKLYHEPNRIAIMSALCAAGADGLSFNELKEQLDLTDGNLSRHLKSLEDAGVVRIKKEFVGAKPRTTVFPTDSGWEGFLDYLENLEKVLKTAADAAKSRNRAGGRVRYVIPARGPARA